MYSLRSSPSFQRNVLLPSSVSKRMLSKQPIRNKQQSQLGLDEVYQDYGASYPILSIFNAIATSKQTLYIAPRNCFISVFFVRKELLYLTTRTSTRREPNLEKWGDTRESQ
jgi:hypothetical protein